MTILDFSHLTTEERLTLIDQLWDSLEPEAKPLTAAQTTEIDRRLKTLDEDIKHGIDAEDLEAELDRRFP